MSDKKKKKKKKEEVEVKKTAKVVEEEAPVPNAPVITFTPRMRRAAPAESAPAEPHVVPVDSAESLTAKRAAAIKAAIAERPSK
jgi:hypothetical protein